MLSFRFFPLIRIGIVLFVFQLSLGAAPAGVRFDAFDRSALEPVFAGAERVVDMAEWQKSITAGIGVLQGQWEQDALGRIEAAVAGLESGLQTDERDRLTAELAVARAQWEADARVETVHQRIAKMSRDAALPGIAPDAVAIRQALKAATAAATNVAFAAAFADWNAVVDPVRASGRTAFEVAMASTIRDLGVGSGFSGTALREFLDGLERRARGLFLDWDMAADWLIVRERNKWVAHKLYDRDSLRRESEQLAAGRIVDDAIRTAQATAKKDFDAALAQNGVTETATPGTPDFALLGDDWQARLQDALATGLKDWEAASTGVLKSFGEWRTNANASYDRVDKQWQAAYEKIRTARTAWEQQAMETIAKGLDAWKKISADAAINRAAEEARLQDYLSQQQTQWADYTAQLSSLFVKGSDAVKSALENLQWLATAVTDASNRVYAYASQIDHETDIRQHEFSDWTAACVRHLENQEREYLGTISSGTAAVVKRTGLDITRLFGDGQATYTYLLTGQVQFKFKYHDQYHCFYDPKIVYHLEAGIVCSRMLDSLQDAGLARRLTSYRFYTNEVARWTGILADFNKLNGDGLETFQYGDMWQGKSGISLLTNANDAYLRSWAEYSLEEQTRLLRYYENRFAIASNVYAYATNAGAGRESADETKQRYAVALADMQAAEAVFSNARWQLNVASVSNLNVWRTNLTAVNAAIMSARDIFEQAKKTFDGKLYLLRLLENSADTVGMRRELGENLALYEKQRQLVAEAQSNYCYNYTRIERAENRIEYADILMQTASNVQTTHAAMTAVAAILGPAAADKPETLTNAAGKMLDNLATLVSDGELRFMTGIALSSSLAALQSALSNAHPSGFDLARNSADIIATLRRILRVVTVEYRVALNMSQTLLGTSRPDSAALRQQQLEAAYTLQKDRLAHEQSVAAFLEREIGLVLSTSAIGLPEQAIGWLQTVAGTMITNSGALDADPGSVTQVDTARILLQWCLTNTGRLELAYSNDAGVAERRTALLDSLAARRVLLDGKMNFFATNAIVSAEDRLAAVERVVASVRLDAELDCAGFAGIGMMTFESGTGHCAFASRYADLVTLLHGDGYGDIIGKLTTALGASPYGMNANDLVTYATNILGIASRGQGLVSGVLGTDLERLASLVEQARLQKYCIDYITLAGTTVDAKTMAEAALRDLDAAFSLDEKRYTLSVRVLYILQQTTNTRFALARSLLTNTDAQTALAGLPDLKTLLAGVTNASTTNAEAKLRDLMQSCQSNVALAGEKRRELQYVFDVVTGRIETISFRPYLTHVRTNEMNVAIVPGSGSADVLNPAAPTTDAPLPSVYGYTAYGEAGDSDIRNAWLDTLASLADGIDCLRQGGLDGLRRADGYLKDDRSELLNAFMDAYDGATGFAIDGSGNPSDKMTALFALLSGWKAEHALSNFGNDSAYSSAAGELSGIHASLRKTELDMARQGAYLALAGLSAAAYLKREDVLQAKAALDLAAADLVRKENLRVGAETAYNAAAVAYYSAMTNAAAREKTYLAAKQGYDIRAAVHAYADNPYRVVSSDPTDPGAVAATNSFVNAASEYKLAWSALSNTRNKYALALSNRQTEASPRDLVGAITYAGYKAARTQYTNQTLIWIHYDKTVSDMAAEYRVVQDKLNGLRTEMLGAEADFFRQETNRVAERDATRREIQGWLATSINPVIDFERWLEKGHPLGSIASPERFAALAVYDDSSGDPKPDKPNQNTFVDASWFAKMVVLYDDLQAKKSDVGRWRAEVRKWQKFLAATGWWNPFALVTGGIALAYASSELAKANSACESAQHAYDANRNRLSERLQKLQTVYRGMADLQQQSDQIAKQRISEDVILSGYNLADRQINEELIDVQNTVLGILSGYKLTAADTAKLRGESGLTNLVRLLSDPVLGLVKKTTQTDRFGNVLSNQYEYSFSMQQLADLLFVQAGNERMLAYSVWEKAAFAPPTGGRAVDGIVFLRDKEKTLHALAVVAQGTGLQYTAFKTITAELLALAGDAWKTAKNQEAGLQEQAWTFKERKILDERDSWLATAGDTLARGRIQWSRADSEYTDAWMSWRNTANGKIKDGIKKWEASLAALSDAQQAWIGEYGKAAQGASAEYVTRFIATSVRGVIDGCLGGLPAGVDLGDSSMDRIADEIVAGCNQETFGKDYLGMMQQADTAFTISEISAATPNAQLAARINGQLATYAQAASTMGNIRIFETLNALVRGYEKMIARADAGMAGSIRTDMESAGFAKAGNEWQRRAICDATVWDTKTTLQRVPDWQTFGYKPFSTDIVVGTTPFTESMLATMSESEVAAVVTATKTKLQVKWQSLMEDDGKNPRNAESFQTWVGTMPDVDGKTGELKNGGNHQLGIIYSARIRADVEKQKGEAKAFAPAFKKSLIPGMEISVFDIAKIGISIAGGGPWAGLALDAVDSLGMGLGAGKWGDALDNVVRSAAGVAVSYGVGEMGNEITSTLGGAGFGGMISETVSKGVMAYTTSVASGALGAYSTSKLLKGEDAWDADVWKNGWKNWQTVAIGGASALATSIVNEAFGGEYKERTYTDKDGTKHSAGYGYSFDRLDGGKLSYANDLHKVSGFIGGIAGQSMAAALDQGFKLNILNTRDSVGMFGGDTDRDNRFTDQEDNTMSGNRPSMGLLELTIGGKGNSGLSLGYGQGGFDVGATSLVELINGVGTAYRHLDLLSDKDGKFALTYVDIARNSRDEFIRGQGEKIWNGDSDLAFGDLGTERQFKGAKDGWGLRDIFGSHDNNTGTILLDDTAKKTYSDLAGNTFLDPETLGYFTAEMARQGMQMDMEDVGIPNAQWGMNGVQAGFINSLNAQYGFDVGKNNATFKAEYEYLAGKTARWSTAAPYGMPNDPQVNYKTYGNGKMTGVIIDVPYLYQGTNKNFGLCPIHC